MDIDHVFSLMRRETVSLPVPAVTLLAREGASPFQLLVATLISLRTRDATVLAAFSRLSAEAPDPAAMRRIGPERIARLIYPAGFYRVKAGQIAAIAGILGERYGDILPGTRGALTALPGVGPKTANLVLIHAFDAPAICVDIHVHRISNRLGLIRTKTPEASEEALYKVLPRRLWAVYNDVLVAFGQYICTPVSPRCSECPVSSLCPALGVGKRR